MFKLLNLDNLNLIDNTFINKKYIINELNNNPFAKVLLYIKNNEVLAFLYYSEIYERVEINQIEVDFIHRNCGIGTKLLKKLTKIVDKNITLEVRIDNIPAIKLYKKFNFKECAIRRGYYNGIDGILMERVIK